MSKKTSNSKEGLLDETVNDKSQAQNASGGVNQVSLKEWNKTAPFSFNAKNYRLLLIGLAINILGYILMIGGATDDPAKFDGDALFSHTRITLAPILIVAGYVVIMFAIMKKQKA